MSRIFTSMYAQYRKWGLSDRMIVCLTGMEEGFFSGIWTYLINPSFNSMLRLNPWTGMILDLLGNVIPFLLLHHQRLIYRGGHIWRVPPDDTKWEKLPGPARTLGKLGWRGKVFWGRIVSCDMFLHERILYAGDRCSGCGQPAAVLR
jgi:hypothetical protein